MRTRVKICCIGSRAEAVSATLAGADLIGLVGPMPSGPGVIDLKKASQVARHAPVGVTPVLLTQRADGEVAAAEAVEAGVPVVQLVRHVLPSAHEALRRAAPHLRIVQVVHVEDETALELARGYATTADALLLDSGRPGIEELGGSGRTHDWEISRRIVRSVSCPVFLAGGLHEGNVADAIARVRPYGVDLCSGVRSLGKLDVRKLSAFFAAVRRADATI
jgi:phosphoribosylanthranilate isomerase